MCLTASLPRASTVMLMLTLTLSTCCWQKWSSLAPITNSAAPPPRLSTKPATLFCVQDDAWKMDRIPEIMDGKNVADYVDQDIDAKLALLEQEEDQLQVGGGTSLLVRAC